MIGKICSLAISLNEGQNLTFFGRAKVRIWDFFVDLRQRSAKFLVWIEDATVLVRDNINSMSI